MWKRRMNLIPLAFAVLLVAAACGGLSDTKSANAFRNEAPSVAASGDHGRVIEVDMTEMAFAADSLKFSPGEKVKFLITNSGAVPHEFRITNQDRIDEHIADGHDDDDHADEAEDETDHEDEAEDVAVVLEAGETETLVFTFPDNDQDYTAIVCLIPGHYEAGMATDLSYEA